MEVTEQQQCFEVIFGDEFTGPDETLGVMIKRRAKDCAKEVGLALCSDLNCRLENDDPHAHIPERVFGKPRKYRRGDIRSAGGRFSFRKGTLQKIGEIRWNLYSKHLKHHGSCVIFFRGTRLIE